MNKIVSISFLLAASTSLGFSSDNINDLNQNPHNNKRQPVLPEMSEAFIKAGGRTVEKEEEIKQDMIQRSFEQFQKDNGITIEEEKDTIEAIRERRAAVLKKNNNNS